MEKKQLPTLKELHYDAEVAFKNDQFRLLLNEPPPATWLKSHPMAKVKNDQGETVSARYLPMDKVEYLLDRIFQEWKIEVLSTSVMFQSISVSVRVHYLNPVSGIWTFHDGVGAAPVQKDANSVFGIDTIKPAGVQMALPAAKSYAIKDACDHIGNIFGRNTNRTNLNTFFGAYSKDPEPELKSKTDIKEDERLTDMIKNAKTRAALDKLKVHVRTEEHRRLFDEMYETKP